MAGKKMELGHTGSAVASNVRRLRSEQNLTYSQLSSRLKSLGRAVSPLAVRRIEDGERRCDVDDLTCLAMALKTSPAALLMPETTAPDSEVVLVDPIQPIPARSIWEWMTAQTPLPGLSYRSPTDFLYLASPLWVAREVEAGQGPAARVTVEQMDREVQAALLRQLKHLATEGNLVGMSNPGVEHGDH